MILTVDEFRAFVHSDLGDDELQLLLNAAEEAIVAYAGSPSSVTELIDGGPNRIALRRPASAITSISETRSTTVTTLAGNDYRIRADGYVLERLNTGTNPRLYWWGLVTVTYTPVADADTRKSVQIELVKLDLAQDAALKSQTIGSFSETFDTDTNQDEQRSAILARLTPEGSIRVVGAPSHGIYGW